jgi:NOL1/NOP2/sun family putative RNA methylase
MREREIPLLFLDRMQRLLGAEYPSFKASLALPHTNGLRVNTLKMSAADFLKISPYKLETVPWSQSGYSIRESPETTRFISPGKHPMHTAGLYYLQDISAMAVAEILAPLPGENVLDLSAAPGGKTTHLAALMEGKGLLVANEIHPQRVWDLAENLERWGVGNTVITNERPQRLADHFGAFFDRVLVDAPCSGEGMFRKNHEARAAWSLELVQSCASRQGAILRTAAQLVRPGGWLVYSTCTFSPEENEQVIYRFLEESLRDHPFEIAQIPHCESISNGRPDWVNTTSELTSDPDLWKTLRLWPHHHAGEGHFIALMQKTQAGEAKYLPAFRPSLPISVRNLVNSFINENINASLNTERLSLQGAHVYQIPDGMPDLATMNVIHPGLWWGIIKKQRIQPAQALAMSLKSVDVRRTFTLSSTNPKCHAYLHGDSLDGPGESGWVLVTVAIPGLTETFPLGWGRRVDNVIKNFYPKGLRQP